MIIVETEISWGYLPLIEIFAAANNLSLKYNRRLIKEPPREYITISYEEESDTDVTITWLSIKHLGFKNMLCDYLIKCDIHPFLISEGRIVMRKNSEEIEKDWQEYRVKIGLTR